MNIVWFRNNLRISDNPPLFEACKLGQIIPVYISDESMGSASHYWLDSSLKSLDKSLGGKLNYYKGNAEEILSKLLCKFGCDHIYYSKTYYNEPIFDLPLKAYNANLLWEPDQITKADNSFYKVFTPYYRKGCFNGPKPRRPLPIPKIDAIKDDDSLALDSFPNQTWYRKLDNIWKIGENHAQEALTRFIENGLKNYADGRNYPAKNHVSRLSPHLHFGEISPNQIYYRIGEITSKDQDCFISELAWREFSHYLLYHFPELPNKNFQPKFDKFKWENNDSHLTAWQKGQTGIPIVDAGMRELWQTGYMHNRVRMIVGSFLVKNLLIDWRKGRDWFHDCLLDADLANNNASWQWVAGSGVDAAPYFRIFNPILQGEKFDPDGEYTRKFLPELKELPAKYLFKPWEAPKEVLQAAKITLGANYPKPIVDLNITRKRALENYKLLSS